MTKEAPSTPGENPGGNPGHTVENDAPECERCEGTGDRYGRRPYAGGPSARCPDCMGTGYVIPPGEGES